ncbi:hypothetical protein J6590_106770, partial [Homalodisca vitripennis]
KSRPLGVNMGSYGREKFPHVREKFPPHTLILSKCSKFWVFFGKIGDLVGPHTLVFTTWGRNEGRREFQYGGGGGKNWREQGNLTSLSWFHAYSRWRRP